MERELWGSLWAEGSKRHSCEFGDRLLDISLYREAAGKARDFQGSEVTN